MIDADQVRTAHADAWAAEGRARVDQGGGELRVRHARAMASGVPDLRWNNADVTGEDPDLERLAAWYAGRDVPWGLRVPVELSLDIGEPLFVKRCFGLRGADARRRRGDDELVLRRARHEEFDRFVDAEVVMFQGSVATTRRWIAPVFARDGFEHWMAVRADRVVAIATVVRTDGDAGPAAMVTGIASLAGEAPARHVLVQRLIEACVELDADVLVHAHTAPDDDVDELLALGFREVPGFVVRSVVTGPTGPQAAASADGASSRKAASSRIARLRSISGSRTDSRSQA